MATRQVRARRLLVLLGFSVALVASIVSGAPHQADLPDVALSWAPLFHVERAAAMVAVLGLTGVILWRAGGGELPIRIGNIEYEAKQTAAETSRALVRQEIRLARLEHVLELKSDALAGRREGD